MEQILLKTVVETIVSEIWKYHYPKKMTKNGTRMPSLKEQEAFAKEFLYQARKVDNSIYLYGGEGEIREVPFYNYLLLVEGPLHFETHNHAIAKTNWKIIGFHRGFELFDYISKQDYLWPASVYVKVNARYEKVNCTYAYQRPNEEKQHVSLWKFYYPDDKDFETPLRREDYQYFVEIEELCEIEHDGVTECYLASTCSDVYYCLQNKMMIAMGKMSDSDDCKDFKEEGLIFWKKQEYQYYIKIDNNYVDYDFFNEENLPYCYNRDEFLSLCKNFDSDCLKCCEFFEIEKKIDVEVER